MGRYYKFSKEISNTERDAILKEVNELENIENAEITPDLQYLIVKADDIHFGTIMGRVVNICSRAVNGLEISFSRFAVN